MGTNESGISHLPEDIQSALAREPIILDRESVGVFFRNEAELADVEAVMEAQEGALAIGLVGSRLRGRFYYSMQRLFAKLLNQGQGYISMDNFDRTFYRYEAIPMRYYEPFSKIFDFLRRAQATHLNLDDVDLSTLPEDLQRYLIFPAFNQSLSFIFRPRGFENEDPGTKSLQRPAAYYPDIDITVVSEKPLQGSVAWVGNIIGPQSGVSIQATLIPPFNRTVYIPNVYDSMLENFRPLSISTPAE